MEVQVEKKKISIVRRPLKNISIVRRPVQESHISIKQVVPTPQNLEELYNVDYKDRKYLLCVISNSKFNRIPFLVDEDQYSFITSKRWIVKVDNYLGCDYYVGATRKVLYMHNEVIDSSLHYRGKGVTNSCDHLNRIGMDNRLENLQIKSQTDQNHNQKKRERNIVLPPDCGFTVDDIPQHINFIKQGKDGRPPYFSTEVKHNGEKVYRTKSSQSSTVSLLDKLNQAKALLHGVMASNPEWFIDKSQNGDLNRDYKGLYDSYFEILRAAHIIDPYHKYDPDVCGHTLLLMPSLTQPPQPMVKTYKKLPTGFADLPDHVRYLDAKDNRSSGFMYETRTPVRISVSCREDTNDIENYYGLVAKLKTRGITIPEQPMLIDDHS